MVAKDRLAELQKKSGKIPKLEETVTMVHQSATERFLDSASNLSQSIDLLETKIAATKIIHARILNAAAVSPADEEDLKQVMREITQISTNIRSDMKFIQKETDKPGLNPTEFRIRKTQNTGLARRLVTVMADYNSAQAVHRQRLKARMKRQLEIADIERKPKTEEEVEMLLETQNPQIFSQGIIANSQKAKEALADIEARHQDILLLEQNIKELKDLFFDVANLVEAQGETMNRIEDNIQSAVDRLSDAKDQTAGALSKQKKARRLKICFIVTLVVILSAVGIGLAITYGGR